MQIRRWDPFGMMRDFDRVFEVDFPTARGRSWVPRIDVFQDKAMLKIRAEVPGVPTDAIEIAVEDGALTLSGARSFQMVDEDEGYFRKELTEGTFKRTMFLPDSADIDAIKAKVTDGILEITIPTKAEVLPKKVTVEVNQGG